MTARHLPTMDDDNGSVLFYTAGPEFREEHLLIRALRIRENNQQPVIRPRGRMAIINTLVEREILAVFRGIPHFKVNGRWQSYTSNELVEEALTPHASLISLRDRAGENPALWLNRTQTEDDRLFPLLESSPDMRYHTFPAHIIRSLTSSSAGSRRGVAEVNGIVPHPVIGDPHGRWAKNDGPLSPRRLAAVLEGPMPYVHLPRLFQALKLDPVSHAAVHTYLLGAFHARSLDSPRPILLVDSHVRGRGKSTVASTIGIIVDDHPSVIPYGGDSYGTLRDTIIAHTLDRRVVTIDNIEGVSNFSNSFISSATTVEPSERAKFDRKTSTPVGILPCFTLVDGQATIAEDLLARSLRCELRGEAARLVPDPRTYAQEHANEIQLECLHALANSEPVAGINSRFEAFASVGAGAYSHVFKTNPIEVIELLERAQRGSYALSQDVCRHFFHSGVADFRPHDKIVSEDSPVGSIRDRTVLPPEAEGCIFLNHTLKGREWQANE